LITYQSTSGTNVLLLCTLYKRQTTPFLFYGKYGLVGKTTNEVVRDMPKKKKAA
jgi:hypothetical protein